MNNSQDSQFLRRKTQFGNIFTTSARRRSSVKLIISESCQVKRDMVTMVERAFSFWPNAVIFSSFREVDIDVDYTECITTNLLAHIPTLAYFDTDSPGETYCFDCYLVL